VTGTDPQQSFARTMLPVPLTYPGMPNPRWWMLGNGKTNFGVEPDTTGYREAALHRVRPRLLE